MPEKPVANAADLPGATWYKSSYSGSDQSTCVEVADLRAPFSKVAVRDSKAPDGPVLMIGPAAFDSLITGAATGTFDL